MCEVQHEDHDQPAHQPTLQTLENDIINPYLCLITITVPVVMLRFYVPFLQWLAAGLPRLRTRSNLTFRR